MPGTAIQLDLNSISKKSLLRIVDELLSISRASFFLQPSGAQRLNRSDEIRKIANSWPDWTSRPWIIAGSIEVSPEEISYAGPYIEDCSGSGYHDQVKGLLSEFDWAIFSYFTTFQSNICNLVTSSASVVGCPILKSISAERIDWNQPDSDPLRYLKTATFYDYDVEGLIVYEAAKLRGEQPPLLLCCFDLRNRDMYFRWDDVKEEVEAQCWYQKAVDELEIVDEFKVEYAGGVQQYSLYKADIIGPYLDIWSQASYDHSIAEAVLSYETNLAALKKYIYKHSIFEVNKGRL
ncbi:hypothetical protein [Hahella ganghwensis]|uniref:hypothetical protein n=1 Tax=Hahella ganghwensis TaxID=286420 RepID=UPI00035CF2D7|nr:hypothetical protein [Hahella ganghwensis]